MMATLTLRVSDSLFLLGVQRQMKDIPPSVIQEQMTLFRNLTPEQKRQAQEQARRTDPASMTAQAGQFAASAGWRMLREAEELKAAGNKAHSSGNYAGAAQLYEEADSRVQGRFHLGRSGREKS